ncbi:hypothetical protein Bbelb_324190 [Branchiostoma belcheri]|nr:hypothetical protein Bbelb_324190 [Branchiostoma belcheri]
MERPVEANSQSSIGLTIPKTVSTIVNDPATLPATFRTGHRLLSIVWYKLDSTDKSKRTLVYSYYPAAGTREAHGDFNGRASLAGKASLRIDRTTEKDDGTYVLAIMVEGVGNEEGFVKLSILGNHRVLEV